jgi:hypothetical protein
LTFARVSPGAQNFNAAKKAAREFPAPLMLLLLLL